MPMRTPVIGDRTLGYIINSSGPIRSVRIFTTRQVNHWTRCPIQRGKDTMADAMRD